MKWEVVYKEIAQISKIILLGVILRIFFVKVFKTFYHVETAFTQEGVIVAVITIAVLSAGLMASKIIGQKNEAVKVMSEAIMKVILTVLTAMLTTSICAVMCCGLVTDAVVFSIGMVTVYKTYWTESQLITYCTTELKNLKINKKELGIAIQEIAVNANHDLESCKMLLKEEVGKAELAAEERKAKDNSMFAWAVWLLGVQKNEVTGEWTPTRWTWTVLGGVVVIGLVLIGGIEASLADTEILKK